MIIFWIVSQHSRECLESVGIPISIDDKNLQSTVCNILNEIDVPCGLEDLEDCHRIKGDCIIVRFSSRRKWSEVLLKKKKLKNIDGSKFDFNVGAKLYIMKVSAHISEDYGENVRNSGWIVIFWFYKLTTFCVSKSLNEIAPSTNSRWRFIVISGSRITHVSRKRIFNYLTLCYLIFVTCVFVVILPAYTTFAKFTVSISLQTF